MEKIFLKEFRAEVYVRKVVLTLEDERFSCFRSDKIAARIFTFCKKKLFKLNAYPSNPIGKNMLCHLPLFMPALGLALFLFLPFNLALPSYLLIVALSIALYFKTIEAMRLPVKVGQEEMIGSIGKVIVDISPEGKIAYKSELWSAVSKETLRKGSRVKIIGFEGMKAVVQGVKEEKGD